MGNKVLKVHDLGKIYRVGEIGTGTLSHDLNRWWASIKGKEDPFSEVGERNDRTTKGKCDYVWALKNINFEVNQGEILGIIGANGAGKSTLLKLLSKVTSPSRGHIKIKGRIASLLEVGTGFHPELTGRENIFLNGAILGMTKTEIRSKFDAIVDFAGVERYIDTPVKRYSSGMYVRLAFAVAAFLEPEILIIDEVLAVGDADFQKKCLGRMKEVSNVDGRTILFVSHNIQAVSTLCTRAIWLHQGGVAMDGNTQQVINSYLHTYKNKLWVQEWDSLDKAPGNEHVKVLAVRLSPHLKDPLGAIDVRTAITIDVQLQSFNSKFTVSTDILLFTLSGECVFALSGPPIYKEGKWELQFEIPGNFLNDGSYYISLYFSKLDSDQTLFYFEECLFFDVEDYRENTTWFGKWLGIVRPQFPVDLKKIDS